jgi:hypothetical protein
VLQAQASVHVAALLIDALAQMLPEQRSEPLAPALLVPPLVAELPPVVEATPPVLLLEVPPLVLVEVPPLALLPPVDEPAGGVLSSEHPDSAKAIPSAATAPRVRMETRVLRIIMQILVG